MLDGLLGRGFSPKCKSLIKATKTRIEVLRRRAEAKQRFLKEDLAKLLANGLDINAFGRTEEFLAGMCLLSCYDFIEYSCEYILKCLSTMQKQRECPEECREPVSSLMFAAARFSDLPELRDLRDALQDRYGNSLEYFANHVFVEKLASRPPTLEKKLQLLQDIASEFSIKWDSKGFEKRMASPPTFTQDQPRKYGPSPVTEDKYKLSNGNNSSLKTDKQETTSNGHKLLSIKAETISKRDANEVSFRGRREFSADKHGSLNETEDTSSPMTVRSGSSSSRGKRSEYVDSTLRNDRGTVPKGERKDSLSRGYPDRVTAPKGEAKDPLSRGKGLDRVDGGYTTTLGDWVTAPNGETRDPLSRRKGFDRGYQTALNDGVTDPKGETKEPLYRKGSDRVDGGYPTTLNDWDTAPKGQTKDPLSRGKGLEHVDGRYPTLNDRTTDHKGEKDPLSHDHSEDIRDAPKPFYNSALPPPYVKAKDNANPPYIRPKGTNYGTRTDSEHVGLDSTESSLDPTPRSRANPVMSLHRSEKELDQDHQNHIPLPKPRSVRRKHSKSSSSNHEDTINPEDGRVVKRTSSSRRKEHSKKGLQILFDDEHYRKDEEERMMDKLLLHYSKKSSNYDITKLRKKSEVERMGIGSDTKPEMVPNRSISLPHGHELPTPSEGRKVFARASSFHPDGQAPHVHPKLPDYDDLAAQFAALRGR